MPILAQQFPVFQPVMRVVTNITNGFPAVVTTSFDHQYISGIIARLIVPLGFGMVQANELQGTITVLSPTTFSIDIDTTDFQPFVIPMTYPEDQQYAQVIPFAEVNSTLLAAYKNVLPYSAT